MKYKAKGFLEHQIDFAKYNGTLQGLVMGFGGGKTHSHILRYCELSARRGYEKMLIVAPTLKLAKSVNINKFIAFFNKNGINHHWFKSEYRIEIYNRFCGEIIFLSYEHPERIVADEYDDTILDEFDIIPEEKQEIVFTNAVARTRRSENGSINITTTPEGRKKTYKLFIVEKKGRLIQGKTTENPYLPQSYIDNLYLLYDETRVRQYINGEFVRLNGVYAYWGKTDANIIPAGSITNIPREIIIGMDFNVDPMTATISFMRNNNELITFDEIWLENANTEMMIDVIRKRYPLRQQLGIYAGEPHYDNGYVIDVCPDMTGIKRSTSSQIGHTDIHLLKQAGYNVIGSSNPLVRDRLNTVNSNLKALRCFITDNCRHLIEDLDEVRLKDDGSLDGSDKDRTHISDAYGYSVCRKLPFVQQNWKQE